MTATTSPPPNEITSAHECRDEVLAQERALQAAQLASDVDALERLLHPDLLAGGPDGRLADRAADLAAHGAWRVIAAHISPAAD